MAGLGIALIAQFLTGLTLVVDKTFLKQKAAGNVFAYVFWIAVFNFFAIFAAPFDFVNPGWKVGIFSFAAGICFLLALIFYYRALEGGEASQTLAILGGFTPLATIIVSTVFLNARLNAIELLFFCILTAGGFVMFLADRQKFRKTFIWIVLAALSFGIVNVFQKIAYDKSSFLTGFAIMKLGSSMAGLSLLLVPKWRLLIFEKTKETTGRNKVFYLSNRALGGIASVMLSYAIKLSHPALIESTSAIKYAAIFIFTLILTKWWPKILKENFSKMILAAKISATILIIIGASGLTIQKYFEDQPKQSLKGMNFGVSFSQKMSENFGLDWRENYQAILHDLRPSGLRLIAYWDLIEPEKNKYDFSDLDWQVSEAKKSGAKIIITIGQKVPRWPECHFPSWLDASGEDIRNSELLKYERAVIERYRNTDNLLYWQIENEPYIHFGVCPKPNNDLLSKEIDLVKKSDRNHKILLTDGGEWGGWYKEVKLGDVFGSTLYRKVYKNGLGSVHPILTPEYYEIKRIIVTNLAKKKDEAAIISELGLEPWWNRQIYELPISKQKELLTNQEIAEFIDFARRTNFKTVYFWGSEWWYFMKKNGNESYWEQIKQVTRKMN